MRRVGIFAGTFDPIHQGHIAFSLAAAETHHLDKVYLLPERVPRGKQKVTDFVHREALLELAVITQPKLEVLSFDEDQFTVEKTLPALQQQLPDSALTLLIGSDVLCNSLPYWDNLDRLLSQIDFVIGIRESHDERQVHTVLEKLESVYGTVRYKIVASPYANASSSQARMSGDNLDASSVGYIAANSLYT